MKLSNAKAGDIAVIECMTSMGSGSESKITKILTRYNEKTGKPYKVISCGSHKFSAKTGDALNEPTMYYISSIKRKDSKRNIYKKSKSK